MPTRPAPTLAQQADELLAQHTNDAAIHLALHSLLMEGLLTVPALADVESRYWFIPAPTGGLTAIRRRPGPAPADAVPVARRAGRLVQELSPQWGKTPEP